MATLTWQDVAGQVRAPDYSEASELMTRGLGQISAAVQAPERLRQEKLDREMKGLLIQSEMNNQTSNMIDRIDTKLKNEVKERDLKEFSKHQSYLESSSRKAAMAGMPLADFMANDPVYTNMGEGAKAYGAARLSDAYMRGDETRIQMEEHAKDDAYRAQQDLIQRQQWNATFAEQRRNNAAMRQERAEAMAAAAALQPKVWKTGNDKTDKAMSRLANQTGQQYNEAAGEAFSKLTLGDVGKGYKNLGAVSNLFGELNAQRVRSGKQPLPLNVLKRVVDTNVGADNFWNGINDVDDAAIMKTLKVAGDQYDTAYKGREYYERLSGLVDAGSRPAQEDIDLGWNLMFPAPPKPVVVKPATPSGPSLMDVYKTGGR